MDAGINLIDTAPGYDHGESERALGPLLRDHDEVLVETKYCPYDSYLPKAVYNGSPQALVESVEESLRRLRRERPLTGIGGVCGRTHPQGTIEPGTAGIPPPAAGTVWRRDRPARAARSDQGVLPALGSLTIEKT